MRGTAFHQANTTVEALTVEMVHIRDELVESINSLSTVTPTTDIPPALPSPPQPPISTDHLMNTTVEQQTLLEAIQQLQLQISALTTSNNRNNGGNNGGGTGNGGGTSNNRNNGGSSGGDTGNGGGGGNRNGTRNNGGSNGGDTGNGGGRGHRNGIQRITRNNTINIVGHMAHVPIQVLSVMQEEMGIGLTLPLKTRKVEVRHTVDLVMNDGVG